MTEENLQEEQLSQVQEDLVDDLPGLIKLFHLVNGEVIIATVESYTSEFALVWRAYTLHRSYDAMGSLLGFDMKPYLSDLIDDDEIVPLNLKLVLSVVPPSMDLMKYYIASSLIPEELLGDENFDESGAEDLLQEEEFKTEQGAKKRTLH